MGMEDDDSLHDPYYEPSMVEISAEDAAEISQRVSQLARSTSTDFLSEAINISLNVSNLSNLCEPVTKSTSPSTSKQLYDEPGPSGVGNVQMVATTSAATDTEQPSAPDLENTTVVVQTKRKPCEKSTIAITGIR